MEFQTDSGFVTRVLGLLQDNVIDYYDCVTLRLCNFRNLPAVPTYVDVIRIIWTTFHLPSYFCHHLNTVKSHFYH